MRVIKWSRQKQQQNSPKISTEELAKTQVLNLSDVEKVANYEKKTSQKPALFVALIGAFCLVTGLSSQLFISLKEADINYADKEITNKVSENNNLENNVVKKQITCQQIMNNAERTNSTTTYSMNFEDGKLKTYVKTYTLQPTTANVEVLTSLQNLMIAYKAFETVKTYEGYNILTMPANAGFTVTVTIDLNKLNMADFATGTHKTNPISNVEFVLNNTELETTTILTQNGYVCK